ncbi:MAG: LPS export ABC transporter permease LptG [Rhodobiaceae bacterium]|nr:LPS export ABC transporter permease LptG [Rhodobiaceae bacterium]MCC0056501.1 LPS export ABC transporter permease LptG [Rhodobiaceae bacterium]
MIIMRYIGLRFLRNTIGVYLACAALIFLVESIENLRRASAHDVSLGTVFLLAFYRLPMLSEQIFPFAVLIGAIFTYLMLSRSLELAVTRAAGFSVWQFILPALVVSMGVGLFTTTIFNPIAANFSERYQRIYLDVFGVEEYRSLQNPVWIRQTSVDGPAILHAGDQVDAGQQLRDVTIYVFDPSDRFQERIEARSATLEPGRWLLEKVEVLRRDQPAQRFNSYYLSTYLTPAQMKLLTTTAETVSFWDLPQTIEINEKAGLSTEKLVFQYQSLIARPLLMCAMVIIAATVSLRVFRSGNIGRMIISGIVAGFVFYVVLKIMGDLGAAGVIRPSLSVWGPVVVALLLGTNVLLFQEDG